MSINSKHFISVNVSKPHMVAARVAGFDTAVYGLPEETFPILFEHPMKNMLIATTKLSHFVTGRHSPIDAVKTMWQKILPKAKTATSQAYSLPMKTYTLSLIMVLDFGQKTGPNLRFLAEK